MNDLSSALENTARLNFSAEYCVEYYKSLLEEAITKIRTMQNPVMVCGPLHHGNNFFENYNTFRLYQSKVRELNHQVFDQLDYLDRNLEGAPFDFDIKFEIFYKGIIETKLITKFFFIPGWHESRGARTEKEHCEKFGLCTIEL